MLVGQRRTGSTKRNVDAVSLVDHVEVADQVVQTVQDEIGLPRRKKARRQKKGEPTVNAVVVQTVEQVADQVAQTAEQVPDQVAQTVEQVADQVAQTVEQVADQVAQTVEQVPDQIAQTAQAADQTEDGLPRRRKTNAALVQSLLKMRPPRPFSLLVNLERSGYLCRERKQFESLEALKLEFAELAYLRGEIPVKSKCRSKSRITLFMEPSMTSLNARTKDDDAVVLHGCDRSWFITRVVRKPLPMQRLALLQVEEEKLNASSCLNYPVFKLTPQLLEDLVNAYNAKKEQEKEDCVADCASRANKSNLNQDRVERGTKYSRKKRFAYSAEQLAPLLVKTVLEAPKGTLMSQARTALRSLGGDIAVPESLLDNSVRLIKRCQDLLKVHYDEDES